MQVFDSNTPYWHFALDLMSVLQAKAFFRLYFFSRTMDDSRGNEFMMRECFTFVGFQSMGRKSDR